MYSSESNMYPMYLTNNHDMSDQELLYFTGYDHMHLKCIAIEAFKCVHNLNPEFINDIFVVKDMPRELRDPCILVIPRFDKIMYGKRTFSYYGAHL